MKNSKEEIEGLQDLLWNFYLDVLLRRILQLLHMDNNYIWKQTSLEKRN